MADSRHQNLTGSGDDLPARRVGYEGKLLSGPAIGNLMAAGPEVAQSCHCQGDAPTRRSAERTGFSANPQGWRPATSTMKVAIVFLPTADAAMVPS